MGNHGKLDRWSTNVSTRTEPGAGDKATGYTAGSQPVAKEMNWNLGEPIDKVNDILEDSTISGFPVDEGMDPIIQKYIPAGDDAAWSQAFDSVNVIDHGAGLAWVALCAHVTAAGVREILALDGNSSCQVSRFDALTGALNGVSGDLSTGNLPSGGGEDWIPCAMWSDGTSAYIAFKDFNVTPNETHRIQAFTISTWTRKSGWPATGTLLPGTGTSTATYSHGDIVRANSTQIASVNSWINCAVPADTGISLINISDGVLTLSGCGDGTAYPKFATSDGTNLYWTNTGSDVSSADIATLAAGVGGDYPYAGVSTAVDCFFDGSRVHSTWQEAGPSIVLRSFINADFFGAMGSGDTDIVQYLGRCTWDGLCMWARVQIDRNGVPKSAVARIDLGGLCYQTSALPVAQPDIENFVKTIMVIDHDATVAGLFQESAPIIFDGRDIWLVGDNRDGQTLSGKIYRIPKALLR